MYEDILRDYRDRIERRVTTYDCFLEKIWVPKVGEDGEPVVNEATGEAEYEYADNEGYLYMLDWIGYIVSKPESYPSFDKIPQIVGGGNVSRSHTLNQWIYFSIMSLFIQLEAQPWNGSFTTRTEDLNFNLINGYADASKSFEDFNEEDETFFQRSEYWNVRGHLFELLPNAHEGTFLRKEEGLIDSFCSYLDALERRYGEFRVGTFFECPKSKAEEFWNEYFDELKSEVDKTLGAFVEAVNYFHNALVSLIYDYLRLYERVSVHITRGDSFISAETKTSTAPGKCLGDHHAKMGSSGFGFYSQGLGVVYDMYLSAKARRDKSKYAEDDEYDLYLRKFYTYEVLKRERFFETAVSLLREVESFRLKLDV